MFERHLLNLQIAFDAIKANKMRSMLTALGIIFGVAAVITMMAIGNGARQEILEQMKLVGVNNIIITPIIEQKEEKEEDQKENQKKKFSPGLNLEDHKSIVKLLPGVEQSSAEIIYETHIVKDGLRRSARVVGVDPEYFDIFNFRLESGLMFNRFQVEGGEQVCIIGKSVRNKFFSKEDPIGKYIKSGPVWLKVIGVLEERNVTKNNPARLGIRDYNMDVYIPLKTMLLRLKNRSLVTKTLIERAAGEEEEEDAPKKEEAQNIHQLDRLIIQMEHSHLLEQSAGVVSRILERKHYQVIDFEVTIPELLLKQQQRTKDIFNIVLGAIAGISLLVGGIGIMNIMLASVLERIKEIGLRLSLGATKGDIVLQFLLESVLISVSGGILGVLLGFSLSFIISKAADIVTIISPISVFISFSVSAVVGLIFGISPAKRAAQQDPVESLRYE